MKRFFFGKYATYRTIRPDQQPPHPHRPSKSPPSKPHTGNVKLPPRETMRPAPVKSGVWDSSTPARKTSPSSPPRCCRASTTIYPPARLRSEGGREDITRDWEWNREEMTRDWEWNREAWALL
jgi:hypothetical protein